MLNVADPGLGTLGNYGGTTQTVPLLPGSPAIDAGLDLSTYFHGKPLPGCEPGYFKGKAPDAGAYEVQ